MCSNESSVKITVCLTKRQARRRLSAIIVASYSSLVPGALYELRVSLSVAFSSSVASFRGTIYEAGYVYRVGSTQRGEASSIRANVSQRITIACLPVSTLRLYETLLCAPAPITQRTFSIASLAGDGKAKPRGSGSGARDAVTKDR